VIDKRRRIRRGRRYAALTAVFALLLSVSGSAPASAAPTSLGSLDSTLPCGSVNDWVQVSSSPNGYTVPPGVWLLSSFSTDRGAWAAGTIQLEVWRQAPEARTYRLVGISPAESIGAGIDTFALATPITVWGGDVLGMRNSDGMQACGGVGSTATNTAYFRSGATPAVGEVASFSNTSSGARLNISAIVDPLPLSYNPIASTRVVDTRLGLGAPQARLSAGQTLAVQIAGNGGVPAGAVSATVNITATNSDPGFLTVFPCDQARPGTSTINPQPSYAVANLSTVALSVTGTVCVYSENRTDVIVDTLGWWGATGLKFNPIAATRVVDTRLGVGAPQARVGAGQTLAVQVTGQGGVPGGATVATLNVTATNSNAGFLTVFPCDQTRPGTSTINPRPTFAVANLSTVGLSTAGTVCVYSENPTDLIVDTLGWWAAGGLPFNPTSGTRIVDTRLGLGAAQARLSAGQTLTVEVTGAGGVPVGATSATFNITTTNSDTGFLTMYPCDQTRPGTSTINPQPTYAVANLATVALSATGTVCVFAENPTDLIIDTLGWLGTP
jgi:hypothetical protein